MAEYGTDRTRHFGVNSDAGAYPEYHHVASVATQLSPVEGSTSGVVLPTNLERTGVKRVGGTLIRRELCTSGEQGVHARQLREALFSKRRCGENPTLSNNQIGEAQYIKYAPVGAQERVVKVQPVQQDPLCPPPVRLMKKQPGEQGLKAAPVVHSPPRKLTEEDKEAWKIPPSVSNWKNSKGYTIPLDKRLAADGRGLIDVKINDNFAKFAEALYVAEHTARTAVETRASMQRHISLHDQEAREKNIRNVATEALRDRHPTARRDDNDLESGENVK